jgi:hypothetical protein
MTARAPRLWSACWRRGTLLCSAVSGRTPPRLRRKPSVTAVRSGASTPAGRRLRRPTTFAASMSSRRRPMRRSSPLPTMKYRRSPPLWRAAARAASCVLPPASPRPAHPKAGASPPPSRAARRGCPTSAPIATASSISSTAPRCGLTRWWAHAPRAVWRSSARAAPSRSICSSTSARSRSAISSPPAIRRGSRSRT